MPDYWRAIPHQKSRYFMLSNRPREFRQIENGRTVGDVIERFDEPLPSEPLPQPITLAASTPESHRIPGRGYNASYNGCRMFPAFTVSVSSSHQRAFAG